MNNIKSKIFFFETVWAICKFILQAVNKPWLVDKILTLKYLELTKGHKNLSKPAAKNCRFL